ncbi:MULTISPECIES: anhydro-N-acetylmuramic acid kinase [Methylosinus]|uniref:Anhydro-N-acetylmuramic acid kinase n=1 Tax=Methylosinus trichosporium (strain ATCC 35070 / NCIMB 11131 / UNIQEM 75 / OB3b) TaxID=595536 RepID=A0A2D2CVJ2_METT3|nr:MULTISPECIES: anhydro-N-acetylmuramic acid kinase [Methylosinus]ATQ66704.1 anhydro-N-acetylmuramic acid kinase [Methylosinus trichosporium OB3b]OBS53373.1 anhydro-N-acetylmuramic acid kinase [Methylosinus sp. 3S-1]
MTVVRALGLMSGTSMDGVDAALLETDGLRPLSFCPTLFAPYRDEDRALLRAALAQAIDLDDRTARPGPLADAERMVTDRHAEAVETFLRENGIDAATVDVIGFHGQTVLHRPERRLTVQIGDGAALARRLGIDVVYDMRAADVAAGGQGAPLVPVYHRALVAASGLEGSVAVLNIGGVANLTFVEGEAEPIACDTGPGNALIDDLMLARTGVPLDRDGAAAAAGHVDEAALAQLLDHRYFEAPPPKSLDRNDFSLAPVEGLATFDAAATLTAFTAASIAKCFSLLPAPPRLAIVCGGGARNLALMRALAARLPCDVRNAEQFGWSGEAIEAQAFAFLAVRSLNGLPLTFPTTTGAPSPLPGGRLARAG